ncbi:MAG: hypothetical protein JXB49_16750 [Bacteroidales bacterium]|nr:hypothetical protein [Bacteroidales bacterium]
MMKLKTPMVNIISVIPSHKILRRMGYLSDQQGIINRYLTEEGAWISHIKQVKDFITRSGKNKKKGSVAVLGSGWLLDVPMDFLMHAFNEVYLYDIFHPSQVIHKYSGYTKVKFVEVDVTGGSIQQVYDWVKMYRKNRMKLSFDKITGHDMVWNHDFVISLNILNQLDILLTDFIRKYKIFNAEEEKTFRSIIQSNHLRSLPVGKSCLVSDYLEQVLEPSGKIIEEKCLLYTDFPLANFEQEWRWDFDLKMNYNAGKKTVFKVKAIDF